MITLVTATELATVVGGVGVVSVGVAKGMSVVGRFNEFMRSWWGDPKHPGVVDRLVAIERKLDNVCSSLDAHVGHEVPAMLADGRAWGDRLDAGQADHEARLRVLERGQGWKPAVE